MRPHRLTATAETRSIDARASDAVAGAGSLHVWLLIGTGVVAAAQIGKAIISVPMIRSDLVLGLDLAGLVVATFATLGATVGIGAGVVVGRLGARRSLIGGMVAIGLGNAIGAGAPDALVLQEARIIEGAGFLGVVLAIPSILARVVRRGARDFVMGAWSAYMPTGIMLMLFAAPLLPAIGWRNFWIANALVAGACAVLLAIYAPPTPAAERNPARQVLAEVKTVLRDPRCLILAFAFFAYSCQIFSLAFALPVLLTSAHGMPLGAAGLLSAPGPGRQRRWPSRIGFPAPGRSADLDQYRGGVRFLHSLRICCVWRRATCARGHAHCRTGAWHRRPCAGRNLCGCPARGASARGSAADHRARTAGQQSRPVCRSACARPVGRAPWLAGCACHPCTCGSRRARLRARAATHPKHRAIARTR